MVALRTVALIDAARAARLFAGELGRSVKVARLESEDAHRWAVMALDSAALEVFAHVLPFFAAEVWPRSSCADYKELDL